MQPARMWTSRVLAALVLTVIALGGCTEEEDDNSRRLPDESPDSRAATEAIAQISRDAPASLPDLVPEELLRVTLGGMQYDLRELLSRSSDSRPSARIVAAYQTGATPPEPPPLGTSTSAVPSDYTRSAPAAQIYECRQNAGTFAWTFLQPEAGLRPMTTQPVAGLETLILDHFRYPGAIDFGPPTGMPPAGPSWRVSAPALDQGLPTSGQTLFIGAPEASVPNGPANVPLLRLANAARIDSGLPSEVFSRTTPDGTQQGYVLRLNTQGGVAPTKGCDVTEDVGKRERVPYSADYYFIDVFASP